MRRRRNYLRKADSAGQRFKKGVSLNTPYAFISLQSTTIRDTHISTARKKSADVALEIRHAQRRPHQSGARLLSNQTRPGKAGGFDQDVRDCEAGQQTGRCHAASGEDAPDFPLRTPRRCLGSSKPTLNPQQRKVAEVSDEYAEKLRKLLEEKKKILAELAKILADDPRRPAAFHGLGGIRRNDLARPNDSPCGTFNKSLAQQAAQWTKTGDKDRTAFLNDLLASQAADQYDVAAFSLQIDGKHGELGRLGRCRWIGIAHRHMPQSGCRVARLAGEAAKQSTLATIKMPGLASRPARPRSNTYLRSRAGRIAGPGLDHGIEENVSVFRGQSIE